MKDMGAEIQHTKMSTKKHRGYEGGNEWEGQKENTKLKYALIRGETKKSKRVKTKGKEKGGGGLTTGLHLKRQCSDPLRWPLGTGAGTAMARGVLGRPAAAAWGVAAALAPAPAAAPAPATTAGAGPSIAGTARAIHLHPHICSFTLV